jgi:hypothetical protein
MFNLNFKIMISGKGVLYTVLSAAGAAVVAGTMLTRGNRSEKLRKIGSGIQHFISSLSGKRMMSTPQETHNRAEFNQASNMGHA